MKNARYLQSPLSTLNHVPWTENKATVLSNNYFVIGARDLTNSDIKAPWTRVTVIAPGTLVTSQDSQSCSHRPLPHRLPCERVLRRCFCTLGLETTSRPPSRSTATLDVVHDDAQQKSVSSEGVNLPPAMRRRWAPCGSRGRRNGRGRSGEKRTACLAASVPVGARLVARRAATGCGLRTAVCGLRSVARLTAYGSGRMTSRPPM